MNGKGHWKDNIWIEHFDARIEQMHIHLNHANTISKIQKRIGSGFKF